VESPLSAEKKALLEKVTGGRAPKQIQLAPKVPVTTKATFLSPGEFKALPPNGYIDPKRIRFSQNSMGNTFQPPYGKIDDLTTKLRSQSVLPGSVEPIRIVQKDNMIFSLDNRRLYAYQQADVQVPYKKLDTVPVRENYKFSTKTNGESITIRKGKQRD
jgi:hypothetical protein